MSRFDGKRILFFQQRGWAINIGHHLARRFQQEGAVLGAVTLKKTTDAFVRERRDVQYEFLRSHDSVMEDPERFLAGERYSAETLCQDYGVDSVWPLVQSMRNYVKSYRDKWYYGFKQNVSDEGILLYLQAAHKLCRSIFEEFRPDIIIAPNFVAYPHIIVNLYGRRRGVRMLAVTDSKVRRMTVFTESYLDDAGSFVDRVRALNAGTAESANIERARAYAADNRARLTQTISVSAPRQPDHLVRDSIRLARRLAGSTIRRNFLRRLGTTMDSPGPRIVWRDFWSERSYRKASERFDYDSFDAIDRPIAFMPLQFQPEANIDVIAPRFNNQIETARQIAMSLPGEMTLVVKDHPAMLGYRNRSYLEKIARTPNVKLVDFRIPMQRVLDRASIIVAPTGTVFFEAALFRIPVIQLGDLGTTQLLPNVTRHTNLSSLAAKIRELLANPISGDDYERRLVNYIAAAFDVGFDANYFGVWERAEPGDMSEIYEKFAVEVLRS